MKFTHFTSKSATALVCGAVSFIAFGATAVAGSDKEQVVVEEVAEGEPVDITVFIPKESQNGSYVLNGKTYTVPAGQSVTIPSGATNVSIPSQTIVTIVQTPEGKKPVTRTYVTTNPVVIASQTVESVQETGGSIVIIGVNNDLPPERRVSTSPTEDATDSNN